MKNKLAIGLAALLGLGTYTSVRAQSVSDDALLNHGAVLEKFTPGNYSIQLNGVGRSDIERSVKGSLKEVFNSQLDKETIKFLMNTSGSCIVDAIDQLVSQGKADDGDSVTYVYGGNNVIAYPNKTPSSTIRSGCGDNLGELVTKYRELQAAQVEESAEVSEQSGAQKNRGSVKGKTVAKPANLNDNPIMFTYATKTARNLSSKAAKFLKDKQYDFALAYASLAAGIDPTTYANQVLEIKGKAADAYHAQSDIFFRKAESNLQKNNIDDAITNLLEAYTLEKKSIELNGNQSLSEEDALKVKIANYVIAESARLLDKGKIDKAFDFISKATALGLTNEQVIGGYKEAGKSIK